LLLLGFSAVFGSARSTPVVFSASFVTAFGAGAAETLGCAVFWENAATVAATENKIDKMTCFFIELVILLKLNNFIVPKE
jgi:hypothetical protein